MEADKDGDGKISFEEFCDMVASTVYPYCSFILISGCGGEYDFGGSVGYFTNLYAFMEDGTGLDGI
jgi:hypothetical protein